MDTLRLVGAVRVTRDHNAGLMKRGTEHAGLHGLGGLTQRPSERR